MKVRLAVVLAYYAFIITLATVSAYLLGRSLAGL